MVKLKLAFAALLASVSLPASATTLVLGSGWQSDILPVAGLPTNNSAWTFTVAGTSTFSLTDCCAAGDVFTLSGGIVGSTVVGAGANDIRATGLFGQYWLDPTLGKFSKIVGAGTYTFSITGNGSGGLPAELALRLDAGALGGAVPEPATWGMMLLGFGLVGYALRSRPRVTFAKA